MRNNAKSLITFSLVMCMFLASCGTPSSVSGSSAVSDGSSAAAPASEESNVNPAGVFPIVKTPITVKLAIEKSGQVEDYVNNSYTKHLEEKTGLKLELEIFPAAKEAAQKMEVLIASGSALPDAFCGEAFYGTTKQNVVYRHAQNGYFIPLAGLIEEYGENFKEMTSKVTNPMFTELMTSPDGNIYALPNYSEQTSNQFSLRSYINQKWLDNLNLKMPTTTEELYNVLKEFCTNDANGNGKPDEIGMMGGGSWHQMAADFLMNSFVYDDGETRWIVENGKLDVPYNKPEWKDGLTYLNKLVSEGLLDPLTFTQDGPSFKAIATSGDTNSIGVITTAGMGQLFTVSMTDRKAEYVPMDPMVGPKGVQYVAYYPSNPLPGMVITKDCKNPEAVFRLGDYMISEEMSVFSRFGEKGVDWVEPDADSVALGAPWGKEPALKAILIWGGASQSSHWSDVSPHILLNKYTDGQVWNGDPTDAEYMIALSTSTMIDKAPKEACTLILYSAEELEQVADIRISLETYVKESMARFATGDLSLEKDWDAYLKELDNIGLAKYMEISQQAYTRMAGNK